MAQQSIVGFNDRPETTPMTTSRPGISVVYPMFNEEENIERAVHFAEAVLTDMTSDYEILIVNDASTDRSAEIAEALARSNPCVKVFHHERNLKLGGALRTGFSNATKELVFYCDSDLPVDLTELNRAARIMEFTCSDIVESEGSFIDAELLIKGKLHGFKIVQFGVDYFPRNRGTSTLASPDVIFKMIRELVAFRMKMRRQIRAARVSEH